MLQQITDFKAEAAALAGLLERLSDADWERETLFKSWTINDVVRHLHTGDIMAATSVADPAAFVALLADVRAKRATGFTPRDDARARFGHLAGAALLDAWRRQMAALCDKLDGLDPSTRLKWAGPDMSVRMFTTARQMETWAHGQEVFDVMGVERAPTDRLKNIAEIGVRTFGWTFVNRGETAPAPVPQVRLQAPSGGEWVWNPDVREQLVAGAALDFCQVVTQVRNVADTGLRVEGAVAQRWMAIAQCFAGKPETPPVPGARFRASR